MVNRCSHCLPKSPFFILCALASSLSVSFCSHSTLSTPARAALVETSLGTHVAVMLMVCRISADLFIYFLMEISQDQSIHFAFFDCQWNLKLSTFNCVCWRALASWATSWLLQTPMILAQTSCRMRAFTSKSSFPRISWSAWSLSNPYLIIKYRQTKDYQVYKIGFSRIYN